MNTRLPIRRRYLALFGALTAIVVWNICLKGVAAERPNILFILADDLGSYDVGWRGSQIKTPNLDALAASGARLERFYVQPVCSPTRAALMTGRYPMRYGLQVGVVRPWAKYGLPLEERTLPQALGEAGYATAICGKWHLGSFDKSYWPAARGFDYAYGHLFGAIDYFTHMRDGQLDWYRNGQPLKEEGYSTELLAADAARVVREHDGKKPLFLYVPFNAVHAPHEVPDKYKQPYADLKEPRRTYAGMLAAMDEGIGRIIAALDEKQLRDDTLIIFSSDNGGPAPGRVTDNGPLRAAKGTLYEGGVRVAACASWKGRIPAGSQVQEPLHMVDWYPTLLKLAGASLEQKLPLDGRDAWATITAGKPSPHDEILVNTTPNSGALIAGDWKLVVHNVGGKQANRPASRRPNAQPARQPNRPRAAQAGAKRTVGGGEQVEFFNLAKDLGEKQNLADSMPDKVQELRKRLDQYLKDQATPKNLNETQPGK
jgi:arylsulfatase A-like enzyme